MKANKITHFVYPYIIPEHPAFGWELLYSIRSIYQFFEDPFDITIIGEIPQWLDSSKVLAIDFDNSNPSIRPRVQSRTNEKILLAANIYDEMVVMHDDFYLIDSLTNEDIATVRYLADDLLYANTIEEDKILTTYQKQLRYTSNLLKEKNKNFIRNFAIHAPMYFNSENLKIINKEFNLIEDENGYITVLENAYYNYFNLKGRPLGDYRAGFWGRTSQGDVKKAKILNHDENGFFENPWILSFLNSLFPKKSPAEK